jgi:hypothetical protein
MFLVDRIGASRAANVTVPAHRSDFQIRHFPEQDRACRWHQRRRKKGGLRHVPPAALG